MPANSRVMGPPCTLRCRFSYVSLQIDEAIWGGTLRILAFHILSERKSVSLFFYCFIVDGNTCHTYEKHIQFFCNGYVLLIICMCE